MAEAADQVGARRAGRENDPAAHGQGTAAAAASIQGLCQGLRPPNR
jgi:hypothetical protein